MLQEIFAAILCALAVTGSIWCIWFDSGISSKKEAQEKSGQNKKEDN